MSLGTVMHTSLSGMQAATNILSITANNLANLQTRGYKAQIPRFATLGYQTLSLGGPPLLGGGTNPIQLGWGVGTAGIATDWSQGPIVSDDRPPLLALDGEGLFILEGDDRGRLYTRDGQFSLNSAGELITSHGDHVLGYAIGADGQLDRSELSPLTIRLGSTVADADGQTATLRSFSIDRGGRIAGHYSDGRSRTLGQLRLARFSNPDGLLRRAGNKFEATPASGAPTELDPGEAGAAEVISGAYELSNVDIGKQLIDLALAGNLFRANVAVFETANAMLSELFFPWRR
jgi:flagellar hook protein FlgE